MRDHRVEKVWETPLEMAYSHAFAVRGDRLLFCGGSQFRGRLFTHHLTRTQTLEMRAVAPDGEPIEFVEARGRGADLWLLDAGHRLWRLSLHEMRI